MNAVVEAEDESGSPVVLNFLSGRGVYRACSFSEALDLTRWTWRASVAGSAGSVITVIVGVAGAEEVVSQDHRLCDLVKHGC